MAVTLRRLTPCLLLAVLACGCAPFRPTVVPPPAAQPAEPLTPLARAAMAQVGAPYRYGGADPVGGFDCSGLVAYVFGQQGIVLPRTVAQQFAAARPLEASQRRPGDLVFFRLSPKSAQVTHVGIYTGGERFVHAPESGRNVTLASLDDTYYRAHLAGYGRIEGAGHRASASR
ncbi:MAG TPA: C40 family peptidase [Steroidobacteraceae bacterium]|nr:C40 family peptidase [Steroidobacteraceae bacterium]